MTAVAHATAAPSRARTPATPAPRRGTNTRRAPSRTIAPMAAMAGPAAITLGMGPDRAERERIVIQRVNAASREQQGVAAAPDTASTAAAEHAANASEATAVPANEPIANGQQAQIAHMTEQRPGTVRQETFLETVERALDAVPLPATPQAMENFQQNGGASGLREQVQSQATAQASGAQAAIRGASTAQPARVESPPAAPLAAQPRAASTASVGAREGLPAPRQESDVSLESGRRSVQAELDSEQVTDSQLTEANDPRFEAARTGRDAVNTHARQAPEAYRAAEQRELGQATEDVERTEHTSLAAMRGDRSTSNHQVSARQRAQMTREERDRRAVSERIQGMFESTRTAVTQKLDWLEREVDARFTRTEERAKRRFEEFVATELRSWKLRRYGARALIPIIGLSLAAGAWVYDRLRGIDRYPEVRQIFLDGKALYKTAMREGIREIADLVETNLAWCQSRIRQGREQVQQYVSTLQGTLAEVGREAARNLEDRFSELRNTVNERRTQLANRVVERYRQSLQALDQRIEAMRAENRGLIAGAIGFVRDVLRAIREFRTRLRNLLREARDVINRIVARPMRFLGFLVQALRQGFNQFKHNIWRHLRGALVGWLLGTLAQAGIRVPTDFSLRSIIAFVLELLGITYPRIRVKVARIIGERNVALLERAWTYVSVLVREGPIGLWNHIRQELTSLWETALNTIRDYVVTRIVTAAVTRLATMFNPAGAIVQAILAISNAVTFFVERIQQIMQLVETVIRALDPIERGDTRAAADRIERVMAQGLTVILSFLAQLLGLGGIGDAIRGFIQGIQERVDGVIDRVLERIVAGVRRLFGRSQQDRPGNDVQQRWERGMTAVRALFITRSEEPQLTRETIQERVAHIRQQHGFQQLTWQLTGNQWLVNAVMNPRVTTHYASQLANGLTASTPIAIRWYKRPDFYQPIYLNCPGPTPGSVVKREYKPDVIQAVPIPLSVQTKYPGKTSINIGGVDRHFSRRGDILRRLSRTRGPAVSNFRALLSALGFNWARYGGMHADHVLDLAWGGKDDHTNLWPITAHRNLRANRINFYNFLFNRSGQPWRTRLSTNQTLNLYHRVWYMR